MARLISLSVPCPHTETLAQARGHTHAHTFTHAHTLTSTAANAHTCRHTHMLTHSSTYVQDVDASYARLTQRHALGYPQGVTRSHRYTPGGAPGTHGARLHSRTRSHWYTQPHAHMPREKNTLRHTHKDAHTQVSTHHRHAGTHTCTTASLPSAQGTSAFSTLCLCPDSGHSGFRVCSCRPALSCQLLEGSNCFSSA